MQSNLDKQINGVSLLFRGRDFTPDGKLCFLSFQAQGFFAGFSGQTEFETEQSLLKDFLLSLQQFIGSFWDSDSPIVDNPRFTSGWGEDIYFDIAISCFDSCGHILFNIEMMQPSSKAFQSVSLEFRVEFQQITSFCQFIESVVDSDEPDAHQIVAYDG